MNSDFTPFDQIVLDPELMAETADADRQSERSVCACRQQPTVKPRSADAREGVQSFLEKRTPNFPDQVATTPMEMFDD